MGIGGTTDGPDRMPKSIITAGSEGSSLENNNVSGFESVGGNGFETTEVIIRG